MGVARFYASSRARISGKLLAVVPGLVTPTIVPRAGA